LRRLFGLYFVAARKDKPLHFVVALDEKTNAEAFEGVSALVHD